MAEGQQSLSAKRCREGSEKDVVVHLTEWESPTRQNNAYVLSASETMSPPGGSTTVGDELSLTRPSLSLSIASVSEHRRRRIGTPKHPGSGSRKVEVPWRDTFVVLSSCTTTRHQGAVWAGCPRSFLCPQ